MRKELLLTICLLLIFFGPTIAKEFYTFPLTGEVQDRDLYLLRRPAAVGFSNITGTKNISGGALRAVFMTRSAATQKVDNTDSRLSDARTPLTHSQAANTITGLATVATTGYYNDLSGLPSLFSGTYADLTGKPVLFSGSYTDLTSKPSSFTPAAHNQAATTITGLAQVATLGTYTSLLNKPIIPYACVDVIQGFRGYSGLPGTPGSNGVSATVAVGTVTTGAAGTNAIITNSGSSLAAVLDFTIPRGLDGTIDNITPAQLETKLLEPGGKLKKRALTADSETLFEAARVLGSTSFFVTAAGLVVVADAVGIRLFSFDATTKQLQIKRSNGTSIFLLSSTGRLTL